MARRHLHQVVQSCFLHLDSRTAFDGATVVVQNSTEVSGNIDRSSFNPSLNLNRRASRRLAGDRYLNIEHSMAASHTQARSLTGIHAGSHPRLSLTIISPIGTQQGRQSRIYKGRLPQNPRTAIHPAPPLHSTLVLLRRSMAAVLSPALSAEHAANCCAASKYQAACFCLRSGVRLRFFGLLVP